MKLSLCVISVRTIYHRSSASWVFGCFSVLYMTLHDYCFSTLSILTPVFYCLLNSRYHYQEKKNGVQQYVIFSFFSYFTNSKAQHRCTMCLCEEASGPLKWEAVEDVQYVAGYLVRGHLAWLGDPVTPPQPGELPWVRCSNITLPWELREWAGNKTSEVGKKKDKQLFYSVSFDIFSSFFKKLHFLFSNDPKPTDFPIQKGNAQFS